MGFETLVLLFVVFSVISSIVNKVQEYRRQQEQGEKSRPVRPAYGPPAGRPRKKEIDLSDWEAFPQPQPPDAAQEKPGPEAAQGTGPSCRPAGEFQEVQAGRRVEEPVPGNEFREASGKRPVAEVYTGEGFQGERGKRPVAKSVDFEPRRLSAVATPARSLWKETRPKRRRRGDGYEKLRLGPNALRTAIVYREILGPPRADHMPW